MPVYLNNNCGDYFLLISPVPEVILLFFLTIDLKCCYNHNL